MEKINNNHSRICKICNKGFASGRAMGGHMRSHLAKLPLPPKPNPLPHQPHQPKSSPSSSYSMHSYRSQNHHEIITAITGHHHPAGVLINGGDTTVSDSARSGLITRRRSKRCRKDIVESVTKVAVQSPEQADLDSEICLVEEVAWNLMSISRGSLTKDLGIHVDELEEDDESLVVIQERAKTPSKRGRYKCGTCNKFFRSYQALGGHRASHKKMKGMVFKDDIVEAESEYERSGGGGAATGFKCPFCDKVFESGQALGGHKKVHFTYLTVAAPASANSGGNCLDLNCPADEELSDGEVSIATAIKAAEAEAGLSDW